MRCKDIKHLTIDSSERSLSPGERLAIKEHMAQCAACLRFRDDWEKIQLFLKKIPVPKLPSDLEEQTRLMCHAEISSRQVTNKRYFPKTNSAAVPKLIWTALITLIVLTVIVLFPQVRELRLDQTMSFPTVVALILIIQNAVMLIFVPIVIRKYRSQKQDLSLI